MKDLILPASYGNRLNFPWIIIFREGGEHGPPEFFLSHGRNWHKWDNEEKRRQGFRIQGHVKEREDATYVVKELNKKLGKKALNQHQQLNSKKPIELKVVKGKDNG